MKKDKNNWRDNIRHEVYRPENQSRFSKQITDLYGTSIVFKIKMETHEYVWAITCDMSKEELEAYEKKLCDRTKSDTSLKKPDNASPISFIKEIENIPGTFDYDALAWIKLYKGANNVAIEFTCSTYTKSIPYGPKNKPHLLRMKDNVNLENLSEEEIKYLLDELIIPELDFLIEVLDEQRGIEQPEAQGVTH